MQQLTSKTSTLTATATATTTTTSLQATSNYFLYFAATKAEGSKRHAGRRAAGKGERGKGVPQKWIMWLHCRTYFPAVALCQKACVKSGRG